MSPVPRPDGDGNFGRLQAANLATQELGWKYTETMPAASGSLGIIGAFTGGAESPLRSPPHSGPALVVYSLP